LREQWHEALLYRSLARLRTTADGVEIPEQTVDELRWRGAPREAWHAFCERWGLESRRDRPHRWAEAVPA
jgi:hypothetical protein